MSNQLRTYLRLFYGLSILILSTFPACSDRNDFPSDKTTNGKTDVPKMSDSEPVNVATDNETLLRDLTPAAFVGLCKETAGTEQFRKAICAYESSVLVRSDAENETQYAGMCQAETEACVSRAAAFCDEAPIPTENCESTIGDYRDCMKLLFNAWVSRGDCSDGLEGRKTLDSVIPSVICDPYIAVCLLGR